MFSNEPPLQARSSPIPEYSVSIPWLAEHTVSVNDVAKQFVCLARTRLLYLLATLPRLDAFAIMKPHNNIWYKNSRCVPATPEIFQKRSFFSPPD